MNKIDLILKNIHNPYSDGKYKLKVFGSNPLKETIHDLIKVLDDERKNNYLIQFARYLMRRCPTSPNDKNFRKCRIITAFNWVQMNVTYENDPIDIEHITYPSKMIQEKLRDGYTSGDCDDHALLLASLLLSVGVPARFKVISQDPLSDYHHIYIEAFDDSIGKWIPLDAIYKNFRPGQEVRFVKSKTYDLGLQEVSV